MPIKFTINGEIKSSESPPETPLLWVIRDELELKGTKFGCGKGACGACTIHLDGQAVRSCSIPLAYAESKQILTLEGLNKDEKLHPVQKAWIDEIVPQCGYCQPGFIMATVALLNTTPKPTDQDIDNAISNICRCGTYFRIRKAIHKAAKLQQSNEK